MFPQDFPVWLVLETRGFGGGFFIFDVVQGGFCRFSPNFLRGIGVLSQNPNILPSPLFHFNCEVDTNVLILNKLCYDMLYIGVQMEKNIS